MPVLNKKEWRLAFESIFRDLEKRKLPKSSYKSFERNPLVLERNGSAIFSCVKCKNSWRSAYGSVYIEYRLTLIETSRLAHGNVVLRTFGQKCKRCNGPYAAAKFEMQSIECILWKLHQKVGEKFYGDKPDAENGARSEREVVTGRGVHDTARCEACKIGKCQSRSREHSENYVPERNYDAGNSGPRFDLKNKKLRWILHFTSK